ncbi:unnamed protein product, partial [Polarella glacialis]
VRACFPLSGRYHFRFKAPTSDGCFGGYVWIDLSSDLDFVPAFLGGINMKALRLQGDAEVVAHCSPMNSPEQVPATRSFATGQPPQVPQAGASGGTQGDLMGFDLSGGACGGRAPAAPALAAAAAPVAPPPAPVKVLDRATLVAEREARERAELEDRMRRHKEQQEREEREKKERVTLGQELQKELAEWARTADGQAYKDIRSLLSTLHAVMWKDSGWETLSLS